MARFGFTGTSRGMTPNQQAALRQFFYDRGTPAEFHHGDCVGADAEADFTARAFHVPDIHVHPPTDPKARAFCGKPDDTIWEPAPYLERNHDIVDATDLLIAAPRGPEVQRSGTWATVRYARKIGRPVTILEP